MEPAIRFAILAAYVEVRFSWRDPKNQVNLGKGSESPVGFDSHQSAFAEPSYRQQATCSRLWIMSSCVGGRASEAGPNS